MVEEAEHQHFHQELSVSLQPVAVELLDSHELEMEENKILLLLIIIIIIIDAQLYG